MDVLVLNEKVWASHQIKFLKGAADIYCFTGDDTASQRFQGRFHTDRLIPSVKDEMWRDFMSGAAVESRALRMHTKGRIPLHEAIVAKLRTGKGIGAGFYVYLCIATVLHVSESRVTV